MLCIGKMTITPKWSYNLIKLHLSHAITLSANQECLVNATGIIKKIGQAFPHSCYGLGFWLFSISFNLLLIIFVFSIISLIETF
jgi:hypothetical protein